MIRLAAEMIRYEDLPEAVRRKVDVEFAKIGKKRGGAGAGAPPVSGGAPDGAGVGGGADGTAVGGGSAVAGSAVAGGKYGNRKTLVNGIRFDSAKEARRYVELMVLLNAGRISDLRLQRNFTLVEGYTDKDGRRVRAMVYRADFVYTAEGLEVVEDVKSQGTRTKEYLLKKKLLKNKGIEIIEI